MAQPFNFSFLFKACLSIHNNIQKIIFKEILQEISNIFLPYQNSFTAIKKVILRKFSIGSSTINGNDYIIKGGEVI